MLTKRFVLLISVLLILGPSTAALAAVTLTVNPGTYQGRYVVGTSGDLSGVQTLPVEPGTIQVRVAIIGHSTSR